MSDSSSLEVSMAVEAPDDARAAGPQKQESGRINVSELVLVLAQSFWGIAPMGLFYGWASLNTPLAAAFHPEDPGAFVNQHGLFVGVLVLAISSSPLLSLLQVLLHDRPHLASEFQVQAVGLALIVIGLLLGTVSLEYKLLWLWYLGAGIICGLGELCVFRRTLFQHQLYFKSIKMERLGGGIFGFIIGVWTVAFFLLATPLLELMSVGKVLAVYAAMILPCVLFPLLTVRDIGTGALELVAQTEPTMHSEQTQQTQEEAVDPAESKLGEEQLHQLELQHQPHSQQQQQSQLQLQDEDCEQVRELTLWELLHTPQSYHVSLFFLLVLTPGWGIKLAAIFIMKELFGASERYSEAVTVIFLSSYAFGRLVSGLIAQRLGNRRTYVIFIVCMCGLLCTLPALSASASIEAFVALLACIGLLYGGCKAMFYSLVFDIFGKVNYRSAFSLCQAGFCGAVIIGGISSAYSFSEGATTATGQAWFYAMVASSLAALLLLLMLRPLEGVVNKSSQGGMALHTVFGV